MCEVKHIIDLNRYTKKMGLLAHFFFEMFSFISYPQYIHNMWITITSNIYPHIIHKLWITTTSKTYPHIIHKLWITFAFICLHSKRIGFQIDSTGVSYGF